MKKEHTPVNALKYTSGTCYYIFSKHDKNIFMLISLLYNMITINKTR